MKKILISLILICFSVFLYAQKKNIDNSIKINTKFEIELLTTDSINFDFKISNKEIFNEYIEDTNTNNLFDSIVSKSKIQGVFAYGDFGGKKSVLLVLKSGLNNVIDYDLKIKLPKKRRFQKTSTIGLYKGVKSVEYWPYRIERIDFKGFRVLPKEGFQTFQIEVKVDSTCIKNSDKNIEFGEQEFKYHLKSVISELTSNDKFELEKVLEYEKSINSEDVSLGHFWSLGEGIYPSTNEFKFGDPISYRRFECPYFEGRTNYFYTKDDEEVKVVSFNWETFKESNWGTSPKIENDINQKFIEKFEYVIETTTKFLGNPIQNITEEGGQRKIRWKNEKGINAYLFNFGNYNEIRLYIYKE